MTASGIAFLVCIDDVTNDKSSKMNSEGYRTKLSPKIQLNALELVGW